MKVARLNKLFDKDGTLVATLYDAFPERFDSAKPLWTQIDGLRVPLFAGHFERRGRNQAIVRFDDIDTPRRAGEFLSKELSIDLPASATQAPADDLIGFRVAIEGVEAQAAVTDVIDGPNPLLEIEIEGRRVLIPAAKEFVVRVDQKKRKLYLSLPEGLLDLND